MALHTDLPIYRTGCALVTLAFRVQQNMPRGFKRSLGEKITGHCTDMLDLMALANASRGAHRAAHIRELLSRCQATQVLLRVCHELRLISRALWAEGIELLQGIGQPKPADPGVAVYWQRGENPMRCMAIDRYLDVQDNIAAVAATLDAMRAIERHGGAEILDRSFTGFAALPAPGAARHWREVLMCGGAPQTADTLRAAYRRAASAAHPDKGGSNERMAEVNAAYDAAMKGTK